MLRAVKSARRNNSPSLYPGAPKALEGEALSDQSPSDLAALFEAEARPTVSIRGLSAAWNERLTEFFGASSTNTRIYWLLASLIRHHSVRTANAMAFDLFLALVPMLGLGGWAATLFVRRASGEETADVLTNLTPEQLDGFIGEHFQALAAAHLAPIAALAGWWLSSSAFNTMIGVFEETFECTPRSWIKTRGMSLGFALLGMILLGLGGWLGVALTVSRGDTLGEISDALRRFGLGQVFIVAVALGVTTSFIALLYRYSIKRPGKKRRVWMGAVVATFLGAAASMGLGYYAANIARYALFYGGLAAIVVLLLWLWLWSTAILIGAEINIALEDVALARKQERESPTPGALPRTPDGAPRH